MTIRDAYLAGKCPCCGSSLIEWNDNNRNTYCPAPIAEGVMICGRCVGNRHCDDSDIGRATVEIILEKIISGQDN